MAAVAPGPKAAAAATAGGAAMMELDALPVVAPNMAPLIDTSRAALDAHQRALDDFERRRKARTIAVPAEDDKVKAMLRKLDHPICLFGELALERRLRLRSILAAIENVPLASILDEETEKPVDQDEKLQEEFFTKGSDELLEARTWITRFSLGRAKERLASARREQARPVAERVAERHEIHNKAKTISLFGSQIAGDRPISAVAISPDSTQLATGSFSGHLVLWNLPQCNQRMLLRGHTDRVGGIAFHPEALKTQSPSSANIASVGSDKMVNIWSLESDTPLRTLLGHTLRVCRVAWHSSGRFIGTSSYDLSWRLWDVEAGKELLLQEGHSREVFAIAFHPDGSLAASGGKDAHGRIWDLRTGRSIMTCSGHVKDIMGIDFSPNGYHVASGGDDNTVRIWDLRTTRCLYTIPAHTSLISNVRYHRGGGDGAYGIASGDFLISCSFDNTCRVWAADDWRLLKTLAGHEAKLMDADVAQDGKTVVTASYDRTFKLWSQEGMW